MSNVEVYLVRAVSTVHGTYNVKHALHTLSQHGADSYVIFADLVKAYDTVDRELLWKIMAKHGCPEDLIFVLRKLYTNITVQLKGFGKGFTVPSTVGVKQGDNLAPVTGTLHFLHQCRRRINRA